MGEKAKKIMQQIQQYLRKTFGKKPGVKQKKMSKAVKISGSLILIIFLLSTFADMESASARQEEMDTEIAELQQKVQESEETNKALDKALKSEKKDLELVQTEYDEYKAKMSPYESLEKAEAEAKIAEIEKKAAEDKAKKEAEEKAKEAEKKAKQAEEKAKAEAEAERKKQEEEAEKERLAAEEAKGYETGTTYNQLARTPDDFDFTKVKFSGKVIQVIEGEGTTQVRFAVNEDYDTILYADIPSSLTENNRVLEDDYLTLSGISMGLLTYESTLGGEITIPSIIVDNIDR